MRLVLAVLTALVITAAHPAAQTDRFFESNGVRIRYVERGQGQPVVLIHGQTSSIENNWINGGTFGDLAKDHRVIAMDARGHGKSGKPHDPAAYGVEMARDVERLLDHLKIQRAHIVGYSMGANITAKLLTLRPERFITATLGGGVGIRRWTAADDQRFERVAAELAGDMPFLAMLRVALKGRPDEQIVERANWMRAQNDPLAIGASLRGMGGLLVTDAQLTATTIPVMAIVGTADPDIALVRQLKSLMPQLKVVEIPGAVHHSFDENSAPRRPEFASAVRSFVRQRR